MQSGWQSPSVVSCCLWTMLVIADLLIKTPLAHSTCYAKSRTTYMVKLQTSLRLGATRVNYLYTNSLTSCKRSCCRERKCDTSMFIGPSARVWIERIVTKNCVLLHCGVPSKCRFSAGHKSITSTTYSHERTIPDLPTTLTSATTPFTQQSASARQLPATTAIIKTLSRSQPHTSRSTSVGPTTAPGTQLESPSKSQRVDTPAMTESAASSPVPQFVDEFQLNTTQNSLLVVATGNLTVSFGGTSAVDMNFTLVNTTLSPNSSATALGKASTTSIPAHFSTVPALLVALIFGLVFTLAVLIMVFRRWVGYFRRPVAYQKADYLINGMYT